jgi:hypothetical protein
MTLGTVDGGVQRPRLGQGAVGVVRQTGLDLEADAAVDPVGGGVDRREDVARLAHVGRGDGGDRGAGVGPGGDELGHLLVVRVPLGQRRGEDRRVARDADDTAVDVALEVPAADEIAGQVVQPHGHTVAGEGGDGL